VGTPQTVATIGLVLLLAGLGVVFGARQVQNLRQLRGDDTSPPEDRRHFRSQARRRLASAGLLLILAGLLVVSFFVEGPAQLLADQAQAARERGEAVVLSEADKPFVRFYAGYWIIFLLVLLAVVGLAFWDLIAIRRYGRRQFAKLQADRRAMIARQAARLRGQRNGH
jgi:hypothetical protein